MVREGPVSFTKSDLETVVSRLMDFTGSAGADRIVGALFDGRVEEWEQPVAMGFILYGLRHPSGSRVVDEFMAHRGRGLSAGEVSAVMALQSARASLYEVENVQLGSGIDLRDMFTGEAVHVREVSGTAHVKKWDVLFAWVMTCGDHLELTGASLRIPRDHVGEVRAALDRELESAAGRHQGTPVSELVGSVAWAGLMALRAVVRSRTMPQLRTTDGAELTFCKSHYSMRDVASVRAQLNAAKDLEPDRDDTFVWLDRDNKVALGTLRLERTDLVLETMSRERSTRGKQLIEHILAELVTHRIDTIQDVEAALRAHAHDANDRDDSPLPDAVRDEVMGNFLRKHYENWVDEPLPALENKSPRKAARTKRGRIQVAALLKDIENGTLGQPGGDAVDFSALRRELGIEDASPSCPAYDADHAPDPSEWLALDEASRTRAIEAYHQRLASHPSTPDPKLHALMHGVVENQLAARDPAEVAATLERLTVAGLSRHEAIHAIASVVAAALFEVAREGVAFDRARSARQLARLRPEQWRFAP